VMLLIMAFHMFHELIFIITKYCITSITMEHFGWMSYWQMHCQFTVTIKIYSTVAAFKSTFNCAIFSFNENWCGRNILVPVQSSPWILCVKEISEWCQRRRMIPAR
jgi:hypothetical protein